MHDDAVNGLVNVGVWILPCTVTFLIPASR